MKKALTKPSCFRRIFVSVFLLWSTAFSSQEVKASGSVPANDHIVASQLQPLVSATEGETLTLKQVLQHFSEDASTSSLIINFQQAAKPYTRFTFRFPVDEVIPPYAARAPGVSAFNKFFPTSIQPHAP